MLLHSSLCRAVCWRGAGVRGSHRRRAVRRRRSRRPLPDPARHTRMLVDPARAPHADCGQPSGRPTLPHGFTHTGACWTRGRCEGGGAWRGSESAQLWDERAQFDIERQPQSHKTEQQARGREFADQLTAAQVYVRCSYCAYPVTDSLTTSSSTKRFACLSSHHVRGSTAAARR